MPLYMAQFAYTLEAWAAFTKNPENRTTALENLAGGCERRLWSACFHPVFGREKRGHSTPAPQTGR